MKVGDIVKIKARHPHYSGTFVGMVGYITDRDLFVFNNNARGDRPDGKRPEDFGYKYSWRVKKGDNDYVSIKKYKLTADGYNTNDASCLEEKMPF